MKILHLAKHENSGAGRAASRLHEGLLQNHHNSILMVDSKSSDSNTVVIPKKNLGIYKKISSACINSILPKLGLVNNNIFSVNITPSFMTDLVANIQPDIVNLHWIGWEFIKIEDIVRFNKPVVWTLHDMWAFTGGCHYSGNCKRYQQSCGACPQFKSTQEWDISRWIWQRKAKAWKNLNLTIVTPSHWLAKCAASSSLLKDMRIEVIPYGLDTIQYRPIQKSVARSILGLPEDKQLILFGAVSATSDPRKGFNFLQSALQNLSQSGWGKQVEVVIFGASQPKNLPELGLKSHYLGRLNDDISLSLVYASADLFLAPSVQDNLPNTVMESLACGTPCVAFDIGGMPDMIDHHKTGYLVKPFDIEDLARGIAWVLGDEERLRKLGINGREKVEQNFTLEIQANNYLSLYQDLI